MWNKNSWNLVVWHYSIWIFLCISHNLDCPISWSHGRDMSMLLWICPLLRVWHPKGMTCLRMISLIQNSRGSFKIKIINISNTLIGLRGKLPNLEILWGIQFSHNIISGRLHENYTFTPHREIQINYYHYDHILF